MNSALLSAAEVAELLKLNVETVYTLIAKDGLPATRVGSQWRFERSEIKTWVVERRHTHAEERQAALTRFAQIEQHPAGFLQTAVDCMNDGVVVADENGKFLLFNAAAEELLGVGASQADPAEWSEVDSLFSPDRVTPVPPDELPLARALRGEGTDGIELCVTHPGLPQGRLISVTGRPVRDTNGALRGGVVIFHDTTEQKQVESERDRMEVQLHQSQKLEAVGQLAAGVAHEINTPIQYVSDNTRFLKESFEELSGVFATLGELVEAVGTGSVPDEVISRLIAAVQQADLEYVLEEIPRAITQSLEGSERVAQIVKAMKEFSHPGSEKSDVDINRAIESTITVARNEWKYVADLETDFHADLPLVPCLPGEFNQVVLNMIVNAAHAIADVVGDGAGGKGTIRISTRHDAAWAEIRIADTGSGIPEEIRQKIFDPFFTTKEVGKGTGQGLAIAYNVIVKKHGGQLTAESEIGTGTTFIIRLPMVAEPHVGTPKQEEVTA